MKTHQEKANERMDALEKQYKQIAKLRQSLIEQTKQLATDANVKPQTLLNVVFCRNFAASHMSKYWASAKPRWERDVKEDLAYLSVVKKLTPEERHILGLREPTNTEKEQAENSQ